MVVQLLNDREAALILRVKPCTVRNERVRGKLGYTKVGSRFFYSSDHVDQYLKEQEVLPCVSSNSNPDRSANIGRAKSPDGNVTPILGASRGMRNGLDKHVAKALALQILKKRA